MCKKIWMVRTLAVSAVIVGLLMMRSCWIEQEKFKEKYPIGAEVTFKINGRTGIIVRRDFHADSKYFDSVFSELKVQYSDDRGVIQEQWVTTEAVELKE